MSEFKLEKDNLSSVIEASVLVRQVGGPINGSVKAAIARAARRLGFPHSRTRDLWYANARRIDAHEIDRIRECADRRKAMEAVALVVDLRERLAAVDAEFHGPAIRALDDTLRQMGSPLCALDVQED